VDFLLLGFVISDTLYFNPLNAELNPVCRLLALFGAHHILHVSRIRVNCFTNIISPISVSRVWFDNMWCHRGRFSVYREFLSSGASHKKEKTAVLGTQLGSILINKGSTNITGMLLRLADNARTLRSDEVRISNSIRSPLRVVTAVRRVRDSCIGCFLIPRYEIVHGCSVCWIHFWSM
jgi:hypothetical protein